MPGFAETQFNPLLVEKTVGGSKFSTTIVTTDSGAEQRIGHWVAARQQWQVNTSILQPSEWIYVANFFRARSGKSVGFRLKVWNDYIAVNAPLVNAFPAATIQLSAPYIDAVLTITRTIKKPVAGTITLRKNGVAFPSSGNWSVDTTTGIVTVTSAFVLSDVFDWSGQYDCAVRFDTDELRVSLEPGLWGQSEAIPIVEILY